MTRVYRIPTSRVEGTDANNNDTGRVPTTGEIGLYSDDNKLALVIGDGVRTHQRSKVLSPGVFYGSNADSGDGAGLDTIKLIPDVGLGTDQYIIVDPTVPNHIHLRAGGAQDNSGADLFLGGEKNHVKISDGYDHVQITTDFGVDGQTRTWTFNNNGDIQLPGSSNGLIGEDEPGVVIHSDLGFAILTNANTETSKSWIFDNLGNLRLPGNANVENTGTVLASGTKITVPLNAAGDTVDYVGGASLLEIPKNADTNQVQAGWIITFPNNTQRTVSGIIDGGSYWAVTYNEANPSLGASTYPLDIQSADYNAGSNGAVTIGLYNLAEELKEFVFSADGGLTFPDGSTQYTSGGLDQLEVDGRTILTTIDDAIVVQTSRYPTISVEAFVGSNVGILVVDISADDDVTVVNPTTWQINTGTEQAPIWTAVVSVVQVPGETFTVEIPGAEFIAGFTYTFRNTEEDTYQWTYRPNGTLVAPSGVIISSEYQAGNPNYRDFSIEMLEPGDAFEHRWIFRNDATLSIPGDLEFEDGTRQSTAVKQGEYIFEFDGVNTDVTVADLNFNLIFAKTAVGYSGSDTHNVNLPSGTLGQRLVVVNISTFCTLTINGGLQVTVGSGPAEFIYTSVDGWFRCMVQYNKR